MTVEERSAGVASGRVRVLLVEDDPIEVRLLEASMRDWEMVHLHGEVATTMSNAVALLDTGSFDVVLLDLSLPDSQGLASVTTLLEAHPEVPVVVLTGTEDDRLAAAAIEAGAQDYLVKGSVTPDVLVRVVRHARERHGLLAALQLREHRFRAMAESAQDAIYRFRIRPRFEFEYLNPAVARLTGFPLEEFYADPNLYFQRVHRQDHHKLDVDELDLTGTSHSVTVRFQRADGERIVLEDHRTPIVEDGVVVAVQGVVRDVTAQQRTTKALHDALAAEQRAAEQLRATNDLKGQFLQAVSHELRTPLTSIVGFSETLVASAEHLAPWQVRMFHERILDNANRLQLLMGDLLDLERLTHAELQVNRVETDVTATAATIAKDLPVGNRDVVVEDAACIASVDRAMVERVIHSLLSNTTKHTPDHTNVTVRCTTDGDVARISVIDDGPGIPETSREQAFEPFWQGAAMRDAPSPGTGVGLAVVRQFAALHNGHAWIDATPGGGTTVHVELGVHPAAERGADDPSPGPLGKVLSPDDASWRYLGVEHRTSLQRTMAELLRATDIEDATEIIVEHFLRSGAATVDDPAEVPGSVTVALEPSAAAVHLMHDDEAVRRTLAGQVEILTDYAHHALATSGLRIAPAGLAPPAPEPPRKDARPTAAAAADPSSVDGAAAVLWATRELLAASSVEEVVGVVLRTVHSLGGAVLPARLADEAALPLDLTLGRGEPLEPVAQTGSVARALLQRHLPGLVADARNAADRLRAEERAGGDAITGLATREELQRLLARLHDDDVIAAVDLHGFRDLALDRSATEEVVRRFASCLREQVRAGDEAARVGEDEFALLLRGAGRTGALEAIERLRTRWQQVRPHPVALSAGIAVGADHAPGVLRHIEQALYLARSAGSGSRLQENEEIGS